MRNRYLLLFDVPLLTVSVFLAFALRFDLSFVFDQTLRPQLIWMLALSLLVKPPVFFAFGMYSRFWRYATIDDLLVVTLSAAASSLALAMIISAGTVLQVIEGFPRSILLLDGLLTLLVTGGVRLSVRVIAEARVRGIAPTRGSKRRVLIVGGGQAGTMVVREIRRNPQLGMSPVGFLDDDPAKRGKQIMGVPVLGETRSLTEVLAGRRLDEVIIAMPSASGTALRRIAEHARSVGVASRTMPGVFELLDGAVSVSRLRQIDITDLLRRPPVASARPPGDYLAGRVVLVTGAGGSIGTELCRQVARAEPRVLVMVGHGENSLFDAQVDLRRTFPRLALHTVVADIRDGERMERILTDYRPSVIFHAAAHKHVPLMEENPEEAITNNVFGTATLVGAALRHNVERFVLISTDKAVAPTSIMGATKRLAETIVRDAAQRSGKPYVAVRFGNVLGSRGSAVPHFKRQIELGGPVTVTHPDMRRFFMIIPEAVHLVLQAGGLGSGDELFVLDMGEPIRIVDLAEDMIKLSGCSLDEIPIVYTGIRPGEKLTEVLWESDAVVEPTEHPEVLRVRERNPPVEVDLLLDDLRRAGRSRQAIASALAHWVETYAPPQPTPDHEPGQSPVAPDTWTRGNRP